MPAKKATTKKRKFSPAQLAAQKRFAMAAKAGTLRKKGAKSKKRASRKAAPKRRNASVDLGNNERASIGVFRQANGEWLALTLTQSQYFKTKAGAVNWLKRKGYTATGKRIANPARRRNKTIITKPRKVVVINKLQNGKSTRRKYRNGYLDLVIMGHAKKTPDGWTLGGKTFKQGKGIVPASRRGYYLDKATGTVFSKKARNVAQGFFDGNGVFHPIRSSADYDQRTAGETGKKPIHTRSKKRKAATKKAGQTARHKAETKRRKSTTSRLASRSLSRSVPLKAGSRTKRANPSVKEIRKTFAGALGKASEVFAPVGTPKNVAKLGKLLLIDTEGAVIKPSGMVYLCADAKGKLHLCGSKNVPIYSGPSQSFGQIKRIEYETAKPHLYPGQGVIQFWHKMGEESGNRPTLYADGKGGLKFRGGSYKITREGIVD